MATLVLYDSLNNKMAFNLVNANLQLIKDGSQNQNYNYGECNTSWYQNLLWKCGVYSHDYVDGILYHMRQYCPIANFDIVNGTIGGFTASELISRGYMTAGTSKTFYLNSAKTDYIQMTIGTVVTGLFGETAYNNLQMVIRLNGTNYTVTTMNTSTTNHVNIGLSFGTYNGVTGIYPFVETEYKFANNNRSVNLCFGNTPFANVISGLYNYANYKPDNIPVTPSSGNIGGIDDIGQLEGDVIGLPTDPDETISGTLAHGFLNIYSPSDSQLRAFGGLLWTNAFNVKWYDLDSISNLVLNAVSDPIDFIVGLFMLPITPTTTGSSGIYLGGINANTVTAPRISKQFKTISFGSIDIEELYGNYLDYSNSRISIYLPYIGTADIDVQEINGGKITLEYKIDCFTGACVANVNCKKVTVTPWGDSYLNDTTHSYSGNVAIQLPISAGSFDTMLQGLVNIGLGLGTNTPAVAMQGMTQGINGFGGDVTTRGSLSSNTGKLCYQTPYLMFTRPVECRPANLGSLHGFSAGVGGTLSAFKGYVECSDVKLDGVTATESELNEIESLLKSGVYV